MTDQPFRASITNYVNGRTYELVRASDLHAEPALTRRVIRKRENSIETRSIVGAGGGTMCTAGRPRT